MEKHKKNMRQNKQVQTSREDPVGKEQSGLKKESKLLD